MRVLPMAIRFAGLLAAGLFAAVLLAGALFVAGTTILRGDTLTTAALLSMGFNALGFATFAAYYWCEALRNWFRNSCSAPMAEPTTA